MGPMFSLKNKSIFNNTRGHDSIVGDTFVVTVRNDPLSLTTVHYLFINVDGIR